MTALFRTAYNQDADMIVAFMRQLYASDGVLIDVQTASRAVAELLRESSVGWIWLISEAEHAIGYVVVTFGFSLEDYGRHAFIDELFVVETHRGRGIGAQALAAVEDKCRSLRVHAASQS